MPSAADLEWPQGTPLFDTMWRAVSESLAGNGVTESTGLEVTATANNREIQVATGTMFYIGQNYTLGSSTTLTTPIGDSADPRWDLVYFDTATSSPGIREGTPSATPEPPDVQGGEMVLAFLKVTANFDAPFTRNTDLFNWRAQFSNEAEEVNYDDSTGVYGVTNVDAALDELQEAAQITAYPLDIATDTEATAYPLANADIANSDVTVNAGTGLGTTGATIALGGSSTLSITADGVTATELADAVDLEEMRSRDNAITATLAALGTNPGDFGTLVDATVDGTPTAGTAQRYDFALDATDILGVYAEADGAGGIQNAAVPLAGALGLLAQSSSPGYTTQGAAFYDTDDETPKFAGSGGAYQRPLARPAVEQFDKDETGTVNTGNIGVVWFTNLPDTQTIEVLQAGLLLDTLEPAPTDLDLVIYTGDNAGAASLQTVVVDGDGTVKDDLTGSPLASYQNTSGSATTVAMGVDNGQFNAGTGAAQDIATTFKGRIV